MNHLMEPGLATPGPIVHAGMFEREESGPKPGNVRFSIILATLGLLGSVAFIGQYRSSQVSRMLGAIIPLPGLYLACLILVGVILVAMVAVWRKPLIVLAVGMFFFLLGHIVFREWVANAPWEIKMKIPLHNASDLLSFSLHRISYGACVGGLTLLGIWIVAKFLHFPLNFPFALGDWAAVSRPFTKKSKPESYYQGMWGFLIFVAVFFLLGQAGVGFRPLKNGMLASMFFVILIAALVNAAVEEFIYRGVMQSAILPAAGKTMGLWVQGMFFGLMHWGSSVGLIAALPTSLLIGVGSVYWGKAVLDTKGLSWVIVAHALVDIAIMAAYFVPGSGKE